MNRVATSLALVFVVVIATVGMAGCGSGSDDVEVPTALENTLKYLPEDSAVLAVAPTNFDSGPLKQLDELATAEVDGWDRIKEDLQDQIQEGATQEQIDALVGNPLAFSASGPDSDDGNIALQVQNSSVVREGIEEDISKGDARALPEYNGAFVWEDTDSDDEDLNFNGLKQNVIFAADTQELLQQAIDNADGSSNLASNNDFKTELNEMGENSLLRVVGDAQKAIDNAGDSEQAEKVKFVKALGMFTSKTTVSSDGLVQDGTLATDNEDLGDDEIPLGAAATLTLPTADGFAGMAINDPDQIAKFAENTFKTVNPTGYSQYEQGLKQLSAADVDLHKDLLGPMKQVSVSITGGETYEFRGDLTDGQQFSETLSKAQTIIQGALGSQSGGELSLSVEGSGDQQTYVIESGGDEVARFGVRGNTLVGSVGPNADLPSPTTGSTITGTAALGIEVALSKISSLPGMEDAIDDPLARDVLASLGSATLTVSETPDEITSKTTVTVGSGS